MTEQTEERRRRRGAVLLGLLALLLTGVFAFLASLATGAAAPPLRIAVEPGAVVLGDQRSAEYALTLLRGSEVGPVTFTAAALPPFASAQFTPATTSGVSSTLVVTVDEKFTPAGDYDIVVRATGNDAVAGTTVRLTLRPAASAAPGLPLTLTGLPATTLRPGITAPIDVELTNNNATDLAVEALGVDLAIAAAPNATGRLVCTVADFDVTPYTGPTLTLPAGTTRTLSELGIPAAQWPRVRMLNTPVNQDGCKNAALRFTYGATGRAS
ncbi:hypothetical protein [Sporichthya polymorpha]|uniref:hypothetical protein n=1 Tax=Sporichthya polymorpha TaxID=35751 RepID=UPI0012EB57EF|nr:hypothetical protein [Sporichthya polymorpha]